MSGGARGGHRRPNGKVPGTGCQVGLCQWEIGIPEGSTIGTNGSGLRVQGRAGAGGGGGEGTTQGCFAVAASLLGGQ